MLREAVHPSLSSSGAGWVSNIAEHSPTSGCRGGQAELWRREDRCRSGQDAFSCTGVQTPKGIRTYPLHQQRRLFGIRLRCTAGGTRWRCTRTVARRPKNHGRRSAAAVLDRSAGSRTRGQRCQSQADRPANSRKDCTKRCRPHSMMFTGWATPRGLLPEPQHGRSARFCQSTRGF